MDHLINVILNLNDGIIIDFIEIYEPLIDRVFHDLISPQEKRGYSLKYFTIGAFSKFLTNIKNSHYSKPNLRDFLNIWILKNFLILKFTSIRRKSGIRHGFHIYGTNQDWRNLNCFIKSTTQSEFGRNDIIINIWKLFIYKLLQHLKLGATIYYACSKDF